MTSITSSQITEWLVEEKGIVVQEKKDWLLKRCRRQIKGGFIWWFIKSIFLKRLKDL